MDMTPLKNKNPWTFDEGQGVGVVILSRPVCGELVGKDN